MSVRFGAPLLIVTLVGGRWLAPDVAAQGSGIREVSASERSLIPLQTRIRYTTMIVLPDDEQILDVICGDKDFWIVSATANIAHVKPAKEGAATNLNLVTNAGTIYSFMLTEKSGTSTPDLKVYVASESTISKGKPRFYTLEQVEQIQAQLTDVRAALESSQRLAADAIARFQDEYPKRLRFDFGTPKYEKPFYVRAIWQDGKFTYIQSDATELPALYELKDGAPSLLNFQVDNGTYVVPKLLDGGYLALGREKFTFSHVGR
jgi:type IV secretion system protein VirB9